MYKKKLHLWFFYSLSYKKSHMDKKMFQVL